MRSAAELVRELEDEAGLYTQVALAVGFEHTTLFVFGNADDKLQELNMMIEAGGAPIGLLACQIEENGRLTIGARPFDEYVTEPWAERYLEQLSRKWASLLVASDRPPYN